jgi:negative regulator of sigma E activity
VSDETLAAYFDGELSGAEAEAVERAIGEDPELKAEFEQLGLIGGLVSHGLARKANQVPQARFEQIWDEIDRAIAREGAVGESKDLGPSLWARLWAAFRPLRWPVAAAAAATAITVFVVGQGDSDPNKDEIVAVEPGPPTTTPNDGAAGPEKMPTPQDTKVAENLTPPSPAEPEELAPMPVPDTADVEIHNIELGGGGGRISKSGTVTVLYVEEEAEPADSERSL